MPTLLDAKSFYPVLFPEPGLCFLFLNSPLVVFAFFMSFVPVLIYLIHVFIITLNIPRARNLIDLLSYILKHLLFTGFTFFETQCYFPASPLNVNIDAIFHQLVFLIIHLCLHLHS